MTNKQNFDEFIYYGNKAINQDYIDNIDKIIKRYSYEYNENGRGG